jgi:hypothetical protein
MIPHQLPRTIGPNVDQRDYPHGNIHGFAPSSYSRLHQRQRVSFYALQGD